MVACLVTACAALSASAEKVLYFNGNTYINMGKGFPLGDNVSLSAWVRVDPQITTKKPNSNGTVYGAGIVGQGYWGDAAGLGFAVRGVENADASDDRVFWQVRNNAGAVASGSYYDPTIFTAGEWHHYLLVRDKENGKARFYVDGALCGAERDFSSSASITATANFGIGKNIIGTGGCFCGWIADVALWDVALTAEDAAVIPTSGAHGIPGKPPYAYFPLDEGSGSSVTGTENGTSLTRSASGTLLWEIDSSFARALREDILIVSTAPYGVGSPAPFDITTNLAADATVPVSCGATPWTNATETAAYVCTGWKLYDDRDGTLKSNGTETSFTYTHPNPAAYRMLEWQWALSEVKGTVTAYAGGSVLPSGAAWYSTSAPVTVTATPDAGFTFSRWTGTLPDGIDATSASVTFTPTAPFEMEAVFDTMRDFYVATDGNDGIGDGSQSTPYATIAKAISEADAAIADASANMVTIHIADGYYTLSGQNTITNAITVIGNPASPGSVVLTNVGHRAFYLNNTAAAVKGVTITGTGANVTDTQGGHVWISYGLLEDCIVENGGMSNGTGYNGGNVRLGAGTLRRCVIRNGTTGKAYKNGGNVFAVGGVIENCLIAGGKCTAGEASGVWTYSDAVTKIVNCTFIGNYGGKPAVICHNSASRVVNCAFYGNGGTPTLEWGNKNAASFVNCAVASSAADGFTGDGCIATLTDAAFKDYANGDYRPAKDGVLLNKGNNAAYSTYGATSAIDLTGASRIQNKFIDIGCYETATGAGLQIYVR